MIKTIADCITVDHETGSRQLESLTVYGSGCENATAFRSSFSEQNAFFDRDIESVINIRITYK